MSQECYWFIYPSCSVLYTEFYNHNLRGKKEHEHQKVKRKVWFKHRNDYSHGGGLPVGLEEILANRVEKQYPTNNVYNGSGELLP